MKNNNQKVKLSLTERICFFLSLFSPNHFKTHEKEKPNWPIWKTIEIGSYPTMADLVEAIKVTGGKIDDFAEQMLKEVKLAGSVSKLDLVKVTPFDLGCEGSTQYYEIVKAALSNGLELCPTETGPQLQLQYTVLLEDECIYLATQPVTLSEEMLFIFALENRKPLNGSNGGRYLRKSAAAPVSNYSYYPANTVFVFAKPS